MNDAELAQLAARVIEHGTQETYLTNGVRYQLEHNEAGKVATAHWTLWIYPQDAFAKCAVGDTLKKTFERARRKGMKVETLALRDWHGPTGV